MAPELPSGPHGTHENHVSGEVGGPVVQARDIHGDVTFQTSAQMRPEMPLHITGKTRRSRTIDLIFELGDGEREVIGKPLGAEVYVEALTAQAVILHNMHPVVLSKKPPRPCIRDMRYGAILIPRQFFTNLDDESPTLRPRPNARPEPSPDFPFTVTSSDPEMFVISAMSRYEVEWHLELEWSSAGQSGVLVIDENGSPFHHHPDPRDYTD
ncbi:hypothetical protein ACFY0P_43645 [Streptomyces sp. NPDC001714]|uniref:hypothetical protein n=1 Tax=Streptomyces sp. NPDC001714 TaxID=3364603 RepID=UPI0036BD00EC